MKIFYATQGTGGGHTARTEQITKAMPPEVTIQLAFSSMATDWKRLGFPKPTLLYNGIAVESDGSNRFGLFKSIFHTDPFGSMYELLSQPLRKSRLVVSDCEPFSAWAGKMRGMPVVHVSHHGALLYEGTPTVPALSLSQRAIKMATRIAMFPCDDKICFHYRKYHPDILTPLIRPEVRAAKVENDGHVVVYLPGQRGVEVANAVQMFRDTRFVIFDKYTNKPETRGNATLLPLAGPDLFLDIARNCRGIVTGAGFQLTSEALFMGKAVAVTAKKGNWEQECNAAALEKEGGVILPNLVDHPREWEYCMADWLRSPQVDRHEFPDILPEVVGRILSRARRR